MACKHLFDLYKGWIKLCYGIEAQEKHYFLFNKRNYSSRGIWAVMYRVLTKFNSYCNCATHGRRPQKHSDQNVFPQMTVLKTAALVQPAGWEWRVALVHMSYLSCLPVFRDRQVEIQNKYGGSHSPLYLNGGTPVCLNSGLIDYCGLTSICKGNTD